MSESNIPHEASVEAVVNGPLKATLFHPTTGIAIEVNASDAPALVALGWLEELVDVESARTAALATLRGIEPALVRYVEGVVIDGVIDRADDSAHAALFVSINAFSEELRKLLQAIEAKYPRAEASPVIMAREVEKSGKLVVEEIGVDPNQVAAFVAEGWKEA